jgi:DNA-binding NarL/FixJ family response regulator
VRVVIAEDNPLVRDGIALILADHDIDVIATVNNAEDLLVATEQYRPDLAIVDVRMPPTHTDEGIRAALTIRARFPDVSVLVFSQWIELTYARRLLAAPGKVGYLLKDRVISTGGFIEALRRVADGGTALDPEVVRQLLTRPTADEGLRRLTARERSVLALLAEGFANQAIADHEHLALRTVEKVIASIFSKLDLPADTSAHRRVLAVLRYLNAKR